MGFCVSIRYPRLASSILQYIHKEKPRKSFITRSSSKLVEKIDNCYTFNFDLDVARLVDTLLHFHGMVTIINRLGTLRNLKVPKVVRFANVCCEA